MAVIWWRRGVLGWGKQGVVVRPSARVETLRNDRAATGHAPLALLAWWFCACPIAAAGEFPSSISSEDPAGMSWSSVAFDHPFGVQLDRTGTTTGQLKALGDALREARLSSNCALISPRFEDYSEWGAELLTATVLNRALCWSYQGMPDRALAIVNAVEAPTGPDWKILHAYVLGSILSDADRSAEAITPLALTAELAAADRRFDEIRSIALAKLAFAKAVTGSPQRAFELIDQSLTIARGIQSPAAEGLALNQLGGVQIVNAQLSESIDSLELARGRLRLAGDHSGRMLVLCNLAYAYTRTGEFESARALLHEALSLPVDRISPTDRAILHSRLGYLYLAVGDWARARVFLEQGVQFYRALGDDWRHAMAMRLWGSALREQGQSELALSALRESLAELRKLGQLQSALESATGILLVHLQARRYEPEDIAQAEQLLADPTVINARIRTDATTAIARSLLLDKRPEEAIARVQSESHTMTALAYLPSQINLLAAESEIRWSLGERESAMQLSRRAIDLAERMNVQLEVQRLGPAWAARSGAVYEQLVQRLIELHTADPDPTLLEQIHSVAERSRFRFLTVNQLLSRDTPGSDSPPSVEPALRMLALAGDQLAADPGSRQRQLLYHQAYARLEALLPGQFISASPMVVDLPSIQKELAEREILIYALGNHVIELTHHSANIRPLFISQDVLDRAKQVPEKSGNYHAALRILGRELLRTAISDPIIERLLIVPDGSWQGIPLAALDIDEGASYAPAISRFDVLELPGTRSYFGSAPIAPNKSEIPLLTIIANPEFGLSRQPSDNFVRWVQAQPKLDASAQEVKMLTNRFDPDNISVYTGIRATSAAFSTHAARRSTILHVATHAYVDRATGLTGLALADGLLPTANLTSLSFRNKLVVINTCSSADGNDFAGEGRMSLSRAFLARGAEATVSTLWPVADQASFQFMDFFYEALTNGHDAAAALRQAQNQMRGIPRYRDISYWGGYQLTATAPPKPFDRGFNRSGELVRPPP